MTKKEIKETIQSIKFIIFLQKTNINKIEDKIDELEILIEKEKNNENRRRNKRKI